jgi:mono/diheme cytochrome c family protein
MIGRKAAAGIIGLAALTNGAMAEEISLSKDLMPLFQRSCAGCHQRENGNPDAVKTGFLFDTKDGVLETVGKIIIKEQPEQSYLLMVVTPPEDPNTDKKQMPPPRTKAPRLSKEEIQKIYEWIKAGAKDN